MAFAVPYPSGGGRLLAIEPSGGELRKAATADLMSMDYMRLLDVSGAPAEEVPVQVRRSPAGRGIAASVLAAPSWIAIRARLTMMRRAASPGRGGAGPHRGRKAV